MKKLVLSILSSFCFCVGYTQVVKPSLNASGTGQGFMNGVTVDYATGIMNYQIPLIKRRDGGPEVNIGISYAGKGVKTEQNPSVVGLGWNLTGTGAVTRTVRGLADESPPGGLLYQPAPTDPLLLPDFRDLVNKGLRDGESDIFSLNYAEGGLSVNFYLELAPVAPGSPRQYRAVPLEKTDVQVTVIQDEITNEINGFEAVNAYGDLFRFMEKEELGAYVEPGIGQCYSVTQTPNSWYLSEIKTYTGETVKFEYFSDISSENRSLTGEKAMVYNRPWMEYGQSPSIRSNIDIRMNQLNFSAWERASVLDQVNALQYNLAYFHRLFSFASPELLGEAVSRQVSLDREFAALPGNSTLAQMSYHMINSYTEEINRLIGTLPNVVYSPYDDYYLQNQLSLLYSIPSYRETSKISLPTIIFTKVKLLKRIVMRNSSINFKYETSVRELQPKTFLKDIAVLNAANEVLNQVEFEYSPYLVPLSADPYLKSLQIKGAGSQDLEGRYAFDYYHEGEYMPATDKDFWGFNKGAQGDGLLPIELYNPYSGPISLFMTPAHSTVIYFPELTMVSRNPVPEKTIYRSLKSVSLPDGGKHEFEYENNTVAISPVSWVLAGGLRIKKITTRDGLGQQYIKRYKYHFIPQGNMQPLSTGFNVKMGFQSMTLIVNYPDIASDYVASSDPYDFSSQFRDTGNEDVFYSYVEESTDGLGKTGYKFLEFSANGATYPYWLERTLLAKADYDEQGNLKQIERYKYQADENDVNLFSGGPFVFNNQYRFTGVKAQYRAFPFKVPEYSMSMYPPISFGPMTFSFDDLYNYNMVPRLSITNLPTEYTIRFGGKIMLQEKNVWTSEQTLSAAGEAPPAGGGFNVYNNSWLLASTYSTGIWNKEILHYDNPAHTYATRIETLGSSGERTLVKTKYAADYATGATGFMAALQLSNNLKEVVEQQKWVFNPMESSWMLAAGELKDFATVNSATGAAIQVSCVLPVASYKTELDQPMVSGSGGWIESVNSLPPYQTLFHEAHSVYKPASLTYWKAYPWGGIQQSGVNTNNNLTKQASASGYTDKVVVKGAQGTEVMELLNLGGLQIRKPLTLQNISNFHYDEYDKVGYVKDLRSRLRQVKNPYYGVNDPMYLLADSLMLAIENFSDVAIFNNLKDRFIAKVTSVSWSNQNLYNSAYAPYTSLDELQLFAMGLQVLYVPDQASYDRAYNDRNYVVAKNGQFEIRMSLSDYQQSGKRLQFTSPNNFSIPYKVVYNGGAEQNFTMNQTETKNGITKGFLSLTDLPNYSNASELVFTYDKNAINWPVFIIPEGCEFEFSSYSLDGLLKMTINEKGEKVNYYYDGWNRLSYLTNKDGAVLKSYKYNQTLSNGN